MFLHACNWCLLPGDSRSFMSMGDSRLWTRRPLVTPRLVKCPSMATTSCHSLKLVARPLQGWDLRQMEVSLLHAFLSGHELSSQSLIYVGYFYLWPVWSELRLSMGTQHANITAGVKTNWVHWRVHRPQSSPCVQNVTRREASFQERSVWCF